MIYYNRTRIYIYGQYKNTPPHKERTYYEAQYQVNSGNTCLCVNSDVGLRLLISECKLRYRRQNESSLTESSATESKDNTKSDTTSDNSSASSESTVSSDESSSENKKPVGVDGVQTNGQLVVDIDGHTWGISLYGGGDGANYASYLNEFKEKVGSSVNVFNMVVPTAGAYYLPEGYENTTQATGIR